MKFFFVLNIIKLLLVWLIMIICLVCGLNMIVDGLKVFRIFLCGLINWVGWIVCDLKFVLLVVCLEIKNIVFEVVMSKLLLFVM